ncbi:MAG: UvrB/UvrC motif-containing protein, partial [Alistipes sp.]|nr:UvrB/UvrC motif-containing protein [Alistipes sp.]
MRESIEQSNRRRYKQIRYNMENSLMPRQAHKSGSTQNLLAQQGQIDVATITDTPKPQTAEQIRAEITRTQADMERAAKSLDFLAAARFRDHIQELEKLLLSK